MPLTAPEQELTTTPLFRLGFRPFFLLAAIFSVLAISIWGLVWFYGIAVTPYANWFWWHGHEMLFGFASAVIAGFLLTAIQNWSGIRGINGYPLAALVVLWLLGRIMLLLPSLFPNLLIAVVDGLFLPLVAAVLAYFIVRAQLWRNLLFVPILLMLALLNALMHWAAFANNTALYKQIASTTVLLIVFLICVMAGRVIPMFTANGTQTPKVPPIKWLEITALSSVLMLVAGMLFNWPDTLLAAVSALAFTSHFVRTLRWRPQVTMKIPLLWSLHIACWFLVLGFAQLTLFYSGLISDFVSILHTLTVGGIGLIIIAMIARVSLGHTGRELKTGPLITIAFACIAFAALLRSAVPLLLPNAPITLVYGGSIACWALGFLLFSIVYFPILTQPRVDGRPG